MMTGCLLLVLSSGTFVMYQCESPTCLQSSDALVVFHHVNPRGSELEEAPPRSGEVQSAIGSVGRRMADHLLQVLQLMKLAHLIVQA